MGGLNVARQIARGLSRHPLRTLLLYLTYVLGFASVLGTFATVEGGREGIRADLESLGIDVVAVFNPVRIDLIGRLRETPPIDRATLASLERELGGEVAQVLPLSVERVALAPIAGDAGSAPLPATLMATEPGFRAVLRSGLIAGRFLEERDVFGAEPTAVVLDEALARTLAPGDPAMLVGRELGLVRRGQSHRVRIVGVMRDPILLRRHLEVFDASASARNLVARRLEFKSIYVPFDPERDPVAGALVQARSPAEVEQVGERLVRFFAERGTQPFFHVQKRWIDRVLSVVDRFKVLTHFIWILDLAVMVVLTGTITLMAAEERYREVALRRVEGAGLGAAVVPFLLEGTLVACAALPAGYIVGQWILIYWVTPLLHWKPVLPAAALYWFAPLLVISVGASALLPVWRIARMSPARVLSARAQIG